MPASGEAGSRQITEEVAAVAAGHKAADDAELAPAGPPESVLNPGHHRAELAADLLDLGALGL